MSVSYITPARYMSSHVCRELMRRYMKHVSMYEGIAATMHLRVEQAYIDWGGPKTHFRPRIVLQGTPERFVGKFPDNIIECRMSDPDEKRWLTYYYEFTRDNLADLAGKGLFEDGFEVPAVIRRNVIELPCVCDVNIIRPELDEDDPDAKKPLVFLRIQDGSKPEESNTLVCYDVNAEIDGRFVPGSGYVISDYFEFMPAGGYVMKAAPEALDDLEDLVEQQAESGTPEKKPAMEVTTEPGRDLFDDRVGHAVSEELHPEQMPAAEELTDPELRALYEKMRKEALENYEAKERRKKELRAKQLAEAVGQIEADGLPGPEPLSDTPPDPKKEEPPAPEQDSQQLTQNHRIHEMNQAHNIDTMEELVEEGPSVDPVDRQFVDVEKIKPTPGSRPLPDAPEDVPDIPDIGDLEKE